MANIFDYLDRSKGDTRTKGLGFEGSDFDFEGFQGKIQDTLKP